VRAATSGSTGFPLDIYMSRTEAIYRRALLLSAWRHFGPLPFPLRVVDVGSWVRDASGVEVTRRAAASIIRVSIALPVERQIDVLARHRPHVISGYPTTLEILAEGLRDSPAKPSPRLIASRGELLHETTRRTLESAFDCRVADFYNCEEIGNIAWECPRDPTVLHIQTDACLVEVVDSQGNALLAGDEGQVLVTNLYNCTMPFIRYALHDRGIFHPPTEGRCACGSRNPRMAVLSGRDDDYLRLPSGRKVSPRLIATAVTRAFEPLALERGVDRFFWKFQVVQDAIDHLMIRIVPDADRAVAFEGILAPALRRIDPELRCTVELADGLSFQPSGKFKKVIQAMPGPTAGRAPS
jgi:phenylacetate-CoA ligase